jgi:hypothetical protein
MSPVHVKQCLIRTKKAYSKSRINRMLLRYLTPENMEFYRELVSRKRTSFMLLAYSIFQIRVLLTVHCRYKLDVVNQVNNAVNLWRKLPQKCKLIRTSLARGDIDEAALCYVEGILAMRNRRGV